MLKLFEIKKYSKIILKYDKYFENITKNIITTNFNDLNIYVNQLNEQIIFNEKCMELFNNNINDIFVKSILEFNNKLETNNLKLNNIIFAFYSQYNIYLFGLSLILLMMGYSNIKILQFMLIDKKINELDLSQYNILGRTETWIQIEYDSFKIEIFEHVENNNKLYVNEKVYKNSRYYDELTKLINKVYIGNNLIESYIYTNINAVNKKFNIDEHKYMFN